jgi:hypothetical protein
MMLHDKPVYCGKRAGTCFTASFFLITSSWVTQRDIVLGSFLFRLKKTDIYNYRSQVKFQCGAEL